MKLLLDQGLLRGGVASLSALGHDAVHVGDLGMADATDREIIGAATAQNRVIVTLDADFHAIIAVSGADRPSVIRVRIEGLKSDRLGGIVQSVIEQFGEAIEQGAFVTIEPGAVRMRRLPIRPALG